MKKITIILIAALTTISVFANPGPGEESYEYDGRELSYSVEKNSGKVLIHLDLDDAAKYEYVQVERSNTVYGDFRRIKYIEGEDVERLGDSKVVIDKYPLSLRENSYYKIVTQDEYGVRKTYPCVKLNVDK